MTKEKLFELIKNDNLFWSYNVKSAEDISDDLLIEHILIYSDVDVIKTLFTVYDDARIRSVWEQRIVPDMRYKRLNVYLGRIFFNIEEIGAFINEKKQLTADMKSLNGLTPETESLLHDISGFDFFDDFVPLNIKSIRAHFELEIKRWIDSGQSSAV